MKKLLPIIIIAIIMIVSGVLLLVYTPDSNEHSLESTEIDNGFASDIQHDNRDMYINEKLPEVEGDNYNITEEYVKEIVFFDTMTDKKNILRYEYIREDSYDIDRDNLLQCLTSLYPHDVLTSMQEFSIHVLSDYLQDKNVIGPVTSINLNYDYNAWRFEFLVNDTYYYGVLCQTDADKAVADNVWSFYVGATTTLDTIREECGL